MGLVPKQNQKCEVLCVRQVLGGSGTFSLYACIALAGTIWVWAVLPETKGLSLEEVQDLFTARVAGHAYRAPGAGQAPAGHLHAPSQPGASSSEA